LRESQFLCHSRAGGNPGANEMNAMYNTTKKAHIYYVYILASKRNGTLYIGVTKDLFNRSFQHKLKQNPQSFTAKYLSPEGDKIDKLIYFEEYQYIQDAILREKQLKKWNRQWKINLIEKDNPTWYDLFLDML
jgi:putative endonuclease